MVLSIRLGLLSIPISTINFVNSRYSESGLHQFSSCCKEAVGIKNYCKACNKEVSRGEILKGLDKDTILTDEQQKKLKESLEGGMLEVLGIKDIDERTAFDILPFVQKSQVILPSIAKGFKKIDIKVFYSFKSALRELNKFCIAKLTQRATEHTGILMNWKNELVFLELPFRHYLNKVDIEDYKATIEKKVLEEKIGELESFKSQAENFISQFKGSVESVEDVAEQKKELLKAVIEEIKTGVVSQEIKKDEVNPFQI